MNVEYTGRQYEITNAIRKEVETGLTKIRKILGDRFETKVILAVEKHRHKAEITITPRNGPLVGLAQAKDMTIAVNEALDHLEKQAIKHKTRWQSKKRSARKTEESKKWNGHSDQEEITAAVGLSEKTAIIVRGDHFEVFGAWKVAVHDNTRLYQPWEKPYFVLSTEDVYNMKTRKIEKLGTGASGPPSPGGGH